MKRIIILIFLGYAFITFGQVAKQSTFFSGKSKLEIVPFKLNIKPGVYRSRLDIDPTIENRFSQFSGFVQLYFPFQRSIDKTSSFDGSINDSLVYGRLFSIRPLATLQVTNRGGNCAGLGMELSFRLLKRFFLAAQLNLVWVEANNNVPDGLRRGLNFHHYWYASYFINQKISLSLGFNHISNGNFLSSNPTSVFDMITPGVSFRF